MTRADAYLNDIGCLSVPIVLDFSEKVNRFSLFCSIGFGKYYKSENRGINLRILQTIIPSPIRTVFREDGFYERRKAEGEIFFGIF